MTAENTFQILAACDEYVGLYCVNVCWCGDSRYIVITSRPRFANKREIPPGEENYAVISYSIYDLAETDPDQKQVILGQYRTNFTQATFSITKVQVIVPRPGASDEFPDETPFRGRFFLTVIENHLKAIDCETYRLFDLLSENNFD